MTNSDDNFCRIWTSSDPNSWKHSSVYLSLTLDPVDQNIDLDHLDHIHWLDANSVKIIQSQTQIDVIPEESTVIDDTRDMRMESILNEYSDFLFSISRDGTLSFWGIQHLLLSHVFTPSVFMILKSHKSIPPDYFSSFRQNSIMYQNNSTQPSGSINFN